MSPEARARWLRDFDPSQYLGGVNCPILFLNGSNDFAYPLDSYRASYRLVPASLRHVSVVLNLPHGHIWTFDEVDVFVDSVLRGGTPLPCLGPMKLNGDRVSAKVVAPVPIKEAALRYTTDTGEWQKRHWQSAPAQVEHGISQRAPCPPSDRWCGICRSLTSAACASAPSTRNLTGEPVIARKPRRIGSCSRMPRFHVFSQKT